MTDGLGLGDAYGATLGRIKGQDREKARLGIVCLMWISHAERPLKPDELCHALAVEIGSPNFNSDNIPSIGTLLSCCQGLVVVDKKASVVRLIHLTLQEYLRAHPKLFGTTHSIMAETCLSYLNSHQVKALSTIPSPDLRDTPFLEYSSVYWGAHARRDLSDRAKSLALKLLDDSNNQIHTKFLLEAQGYYAHFAFFFNPKLRLFGGLHYASIFGIVEIVVGLVEMEGCDINQKDFIGNTPLTWATCNGHEGVVEILLGRDNINLNKQGIGSQTPLYCAVRNGHDEVVKMLLQRDDVNPDEPNKDNQTPLCCAAQDGREGVVKMLLGRGDVNPNKPGSHGRTPLCCAAQSGHEGVVEILLGRDDVNPEKPSNNGSTPLRNAAQGGHEGVVEILLGRDGVNPDKPDYSGLTPLWWAARYGHEGVVKVLLGRIDVNPNIAGSDSQTPLFCAAQSGREGVVKMLLGRIDVNPNKADKDGQTPLFCATKVESNQFYNAPTPHARG